MHLQLYVFIDEYGSSMNEALKNETISPIITKMVNTLTFDVQTILQYIEDCL
jgi:hypothetical protein